ncbi:Phosphoenolpyruvate/pyruvate domain-containing protein [Trichodelitschia bisporula]|uniref:Phosphoenolpyruvate/pyruvate domain-containing protein n=1 Tax=Trichodelitschia bisporula TaxID=703511 RepID=A0A6G1HMP0_9PEZI|nr:Phosphoenolpyruvate/pyruvate domain-containing protein [Trichodelitschia bisporula]
MESEPVPLLTSTDGPPEHPAARLRRMIEDPNAFILAPGVYDGFSARVALGVGFEALYMTGAGTTASRLGRADLGLASLPDMVANASTLASLSSTPLLADMDTGYGGPVAVARSTEAYIRAGVAGLHIEDQVAEKRCGHLGGKRVVGMGEWRARVRACVAARRRAGSDIVIVARTDALQLLGYQSAVERLRVAREEGADMGFLEGVRNEGEMRQIVADMFPWPMVLNMVEHGVTPRVGRKKARSIGFRMVIWPFATLGPAYLAMREGLEGLKREGEVRLPVECGPRGIFEVCGLEEDIRVDEEAGGEAFRGV